MRQSPPSARRPSPYIGVTAQDADRLLKGTSIADLAKRTGLSYMLIYNIAHGRVKTITIRNYRILFGPPPPDRRPRKIDGSRFRAMVNLWVYLDGNAKKADIFREYRGQGAPKRIDYRIFSGRVRTLDPDLERFMQDKFARAGIDENTLDQWISEMKQEAEADRVAYGRIRPMLLFLKQALGVGPSTLLRQAQSRYESGMLQSVTSETFERVSELTATTERALAAGDRLAIDRLREALRDGKADRTLFAEIKEELDFLRRYGRKGVRHYLGRGVWAFEKGGVKRIPTWRADRIRSDCEALVRERPDLPLGALPRSARMAQFRRLKGVLSARMIHLFSDREGDLLEKRILAPSRPHREYQTAAAGKTQFELVARKLQMRRKAFDLMVAKHCDIFRAVGQYTDRWYLSDLYLRELAEKEAFPLVSLKYETLARQVSGAGRADACLH
jgi:hypothetical protein